VLFRIAPSYSYGFDVFLSILYPQPPFLQGYVSFKLHWVRRRRKTVIIFSSILQIRDSHMLYLLSHVTCRWTLISRVAIGAINTFFFSGVAESCILFVYEGLRVPFRSMISMWSFEDPQPRGWATLTIFATFKVLF